MQTIKLAREVKNIYVDLSAQFSTLQTRVTLAELPDKCLFGTDAPYGEPSVSMDMICRLSPSSETTQKVLVENISKLLWGRDA